MAEETISIFKVDTTEPIQSIQDIKDNIKSLKDALGEMTIGTDEYKEALKELKVNQNALKDAMYGTTATLEDISASAKGTSKSYNGLVHQMASLKEELRATDVSTEEGRQKFKELAKQIDETNNVLKEMDELQGNFQRNVGNYPGTFKKWSGAIDALDKGLKATTQGLGGLKNAADAVGKMPVWTMFGILVTTLGGLVSKFKQSEEGTKAMQAGMANLEPLLNIINGLLKKLGEWIGTGIAKLGEIAKKSEGTFKNIIVGAVGVGNALKEYLLTPIRTIIDAAKGLGETFKHIFKGEFKEAGEVAKQTASNIADDFKKGFSFKANFAVGKEVGEAFVQGLGDTSVKEDVKEEAKGLAGIIRSQMDEIAKAVEKDLESIFDELEKEQAQESELARRRADEHLKALNKEYHNRKDFAEIEIEDERDKAEVLYALQVETNNRRLALLQQYYQDAVERGDFEAMVTYEQEIADTEVEIEKNAMIERKRLRDQDLKDEEEKINAKKQLYSSLVSGTSSMINSIASLLEADAENSERNAEAIKALRISSATIDTISGAIGAYMQSVATIPPPIGAIVGAVQAASITAAGIANIAKIKSTQISTSAQATGVSTSFPSAITQAPTLQTQMTNVRTMTTASEEERLNQMASSQRVYIVASDIQASQNAIRTQIAESSF